MADAFNARPTFEFPTPVKLYSSKMLETLDSALKTLVTSFQAVAAEDGHAVVLRVNGFGVPEFRVMKSCLRERLFGSKPEGKEISDEELHEAALRKDYIKVGATKTAAKDLAFVFAILSTKNGKGKKLTYPLTMIESYFGKSYVDEAIGKPLNPLESAKRGVVMRELSSVEAARLEKLKEVFSSYKTELLELEAKKLEAVKAIRAEYDPQVMDLCKKVGFDPGFKLNEPDDKIQSSYYYGL